MTDPNLTYPGAVSPEANPASQKKGLAITTLVLGIFAIIGSWIPFVSIGSAIIGLAGLVIGVIAIVQAVKGKAGGKGMSITGAILSGLAIVFAIISTALGAALVGDSINETSDDIAAAPVEEPAQTDDLAVTDDDGTAEEEPADEPALVDVEPLVILDQQAWRDSTDYWHYFILIDNPSDQALYDDLFDDVTIELLDAEGTILASDNTYPTILPGGETALVGMIFSSSTIGEDEVASMEVYLPQEPTIVEAGELGSFTVAGIETSEDMFSSTVTGTVESNFAEDQEDVLVDVLVFDADGKVVDRSSTIIDRLPAEGKSRFETSFYAIESLDGMTVKAWANPLF